jgi:hypothetical protein
LPFISLPRTAVLGYFRTSLRDSVDGTADLSIALHSVGKHFQDGCGTADPSASLGMTKGMVAIPISIR